MKHLRWIAGLLVAAALFLFWGARVGIAPPLEAEPPAPPPQEFRPVATSLDAAAKAADQMPRLHSLLVSWRGELILERYAKGITASRLANIKSASKSVISALTGIAVDRGLIPNVRQPIDAYFGDVLKIEKEPVKRTITVENLLTMQSGLQTTSNRFYGAWVLSGNWVRHALTRPMTSIPGTRMEYSTGNTHLLSAILTKATGKNTWQFAQEALAKPLGFSLARWPQDPQGIYFGGNDMLMTPRQMLKFGELYLNRGKAGDVQVLPAAWVEASFTPRVDSPREFGRSYGYGWWIRDMAGYTANYAWGYGGQFIFVVPELQLVTVITSKSDADDRDERRSGNRSIYTLVEDFVIPSIAPPAASASQTP
jgi:CubicO group peptidase (beta-lactamase class C family)